MSGKPPGKFGPSRFKLHSMPISHFVESLRFTLDLLDVPYEEECNAGLLSYFLHGDSVPRLEDRASMSLLGNSGEAMQFLGAALAPQLATRPAAAALMRRTPETASWEHELSLYGHAIQRYAYSIILGAGADPRISQAFWGAYTPQVPLVQRLVARFLHPMFVRAMRTAMSLTNERKVANSKKAIDRMLERVDAALSSGGALPLAGTSQPGQPGGRFLTGPHLSYVDVKFASLTAVLMSRHLLLQAPNGRGSLATAKGAQPLAPQDMYARGQFNFALAFGGRSEAFVANAPAPLLQLEEELLARPCGQFVLEVYRSYRGEALQ